MLIDGLTNSLAHRVLALKVGTKPQYSLLVGALCCLCFTPSFAKTQAELAASVNLLGTWSKDCAKPPGNLNYHLIYESVEGGGVRARADFGDSTFVDDVDRLTPMDRSTFSVRQRRLDKEGRVVEIGSGKNRKMDSGWDNIVTIEGDRMRTVRSTYHGNVQVDNGIDKASGKLLPELHRCRSKEVPTA